MAERVEDALNETRILVLVVQVLIGFQFQSAFTKGFERLGHGGQLALLFCLAGQLLTLGLLLLPSAYHRIVDEGQLSRGLTRLTTRVVGVALALMAGSLGLQFAVMAASIVGRLAASALGVAVAAVALIFWWGLEAAERARRKAGADRPSSAAEEHDVKEDSPLPQKIKFALTETRVVLPGAQALLGFQFTCILSEPFSSLPDPLKRLHLCSLAAIAMCAILLMAPAAYHRIVERGESTEPMLQFTARMLLAAMVFLGLGIGLDVVVLVEKVEGSMPWAVAAGLATTLVSFALWFGYTLAARAHPRGHIIDPSRPSAH